MVNEDRFQLRLTSATSTRVSKPSGNTQEIALAIITNAVSRLTAKMASFPSHLQEQSPASQHCQMEQNQRKRAFNDAFRTLDEIESLDLEMYTVKVKVRKLRFDQAYQDAAIKLWLLSRHMNACCNFEMVADGQLWEFRSVLQFIQLNENGDAVATQEVRGTKIFDDEPDAMREVCDVALYCLLYQGPLERAEFGCGGELPFDFLGYNDDARLSGSRFTRMLPFRGGVIAEEKGAKLPPLVEMLSAKKADCEEMDEVAAKMKKTKLSVRDSVFITFNSDIAPRIILERSH